VRDRRKIYLDILYTGLLNCRSAGWRGDAAAAAAEADHLHNIPSLLSDDNEARHDYYLDLETGCYVVTLAKRADAVEAEGCRRRFERYWQELRELRSARRATPAGADSGGDNGRDDGDVARNGGTSHDRR
jgi:hypothetical protein